MYTIGQRISSGGYKTCYECIEDSSKVLLVSHEAGVQLVQKEYEDLQTLKKAQIPVFDVQLVTATRHGGSSVAALLGDKYDFAFKSPAYVINNKGATASFPGFRAEHADAIDLIADRFVSARIGIDDPQYLAMNDGRLVLADPNNIIPGGPGFVERLRNTARNIREIIQTQQVKAA